MKILYITECFPFGKGEAFISSEVKELRCRGHDVVIVPLRVVKEIVHEDAATFISLTTAESNFSPKVLLAAAMTICLSFLTVLKYLFLFLTQSKLRNRYRNLQCFFKSLWLARFAKKLKVDHIHAHWAVCTSSMAMVASDITGIPWSFTAHRYDIVENNLLSEKTKSASFARFISKSGLELASQLMGTAHVEKSCVLHMGVPIPVVNNENNNFIPPFVLLCPANFVEVKGHKYLIDAIKIVKNQNINLELWLAGTGTLYQETVVHVDNCELTDVVKFLGQLSHTDLINLYKKSQIDSVVLPSINLGSGHHEGIPVALMEAMSYAIPVISTNTGGIPELIGEGMGLIVDDKNAEQLASAIIYLLTMDKERLLLASKGRQQIVDNFSILSVVNGLEHRMLNTVQNK